MKKIDNSISQHEYEYGDYIIYRHYKDVEYVAKFLHYMPYNTALCKIAIADYMCSAENFQISTLQVEIQDIRPFTPLEATKYKLVAQTKKKASRAKKNLTDADEGSDF